MSKPSEFADLWHAAQRQRSAVLRNGLSNSLSRWSQAKWAAELDARERALVEKKHSGLERALRARIGPPEPEVRWRAKEALRSCFDAIRAATTIVELKAAAFGFVQSVEARIPRSKP